MPHALIVDDNQVGIQVLAQLLEVANVSYSTLQDPRLIEQAVMNLEEIDVVFLDLEMPNLDGYQILDYLKNEINITSPIIAYTVNVNAMTEAKQAGFDGFLAKPLHKDRFQGYLNRIFKGESVWEAD